MAEIVEMTYDDVATVDLLADAGVALPKVRVMPVGQYSAFDYDQPTGLIHTAGFGSYRADGSAIRGIGCLPHLRELWRPLLGDLEFLELDELVEAAACTARRALGELHAGLGLKNISRVIQVVPVTQAVTGYPEAHRVANGFSQVLELAARALGWFYPADPARMATCVAACPTGLAFEGRIVLKHC